MVFSFKSRVEVDNWVEDIVLEISPITLSVYNTSVLAEISNLVYFKNSLILEDEAQLVISGFRLSELHFSIFNSK